MRHIIYAGGHWYYGAVKYRSVGPAASRHAARTQRSVRTTTQYLFVRTPFGNLARGTSFSGHAIEVLDVVCAALCELSVSYEHTKSARPWGPNHEQH